MSRFHVPGIGYLDTSPWVAVSLLVAAVVTIPIYRITLHPLAKYPGPIIWSISRLPWHVSLHRGRLHLDIYKLHQQYGKVVRIAPNELSYTDVDAFRDVYTIRPGHNPLPRNDVWFRRPIKMMEREASIMDWDEAPHARLREAFVGAFSESGINEMSPVVVKYVALMVEQLKKLTERTKAEDKNNSVINLVDWLNFTTFDINGELSLGEGFGGIEAGKIHPWVDINLQFGKGVIVMASVNFLWPLGKALAFAIPEAAREQFEYHKKLTRERVGERLSEGKGKLDIMGAVERHNTDCKAKGQPEKMLSREEMDVNMSVFVFAGSETTSSSLCSIFRYLLQNQQSMQKLVKELRERFESEQDITTACIGKLDYLNAVIQEGIRLGPPSAIAVPRMIPAGGEEICGKHVPDGALVSVSAYSINRSPDYFHEPGHFIPERFMPGQKDARDNLDAFHPFILGRHTCIGYRLAWVMMRLIIARLLYTFDMELLNDVGDYGQQKNFVYWEKEPLMVKVKRYSSST